MIIADSSNWDTETPALTMTLRGAVAFNLRVSTLAHASHSGMFGGAVPDAMMAAIELLATLWRKDGSVAVSGLKALPGRTPEYGEELLRAESGLLDGVDPIGRGDILSRLWYQPSITVTGIDAPSIRNASNTLIPTLRVRVAARIAPGQSAAEAFTALETHLLQHSPRGAQLTIEDLALAESVLVDADWAAAESLDALREAWGTDAVEMGVGGSIPIISELVERFPQTQILITGVEDPDSRAHSPNESLHLPTLRRAILAEAFLLARLNERQQDSGADAT
jgi:acetylornithine deacetylase/succinyl-diaminopimelate desuccinylase-like protein